jgi:GNAT superfamily N-acetyltransferase
MAELTIYTEEEFPSDLEWQALSFVRIEWSSTFSKETRLTKHLWRGRHPAHLVIAEEGVLISYAAVTRNVAEHAGTTYTTYGLSSVLTYPSFRREGYGRQVVDAAAHLIEESSDADLALLWCEPHLVHFYRQSGWVLMEDVTVLMGSKEDPHTYEEPNLVVMMLFPSEKGRMAQRTLREHPMYIGEHGW